MIYILHYYYSLVIILTLSIYIIRFHYNKRVPENISDKTQNNVNILDTASTLSDNHDDSGSKSK